MDSIEITIDTDIHDLRRIALWRLFRSKLYWLYCGATVIGTMVLLKYALDVIFISVFLMILPVSGALGMARYAWKKVEGLKKRCIRFELEGIRSIVDQEEVLHAEVLYRWQEAMIITETKRYFFATVGKGKRPVFTLCKYRLDQATIDNVRAFMTRKISEVSGN